MCLCFVGCNKNSNDKQQKISEIDQTITINNEKIENETFILYNGNEIKLEPGIQYLRDMEINEENNRKYNTKYYNYENGKYIGESEGTFGEATYEGVSVVKNVNKIAISEKYDAIPRSYTTINELPRQLMDMADCTTVEIHSIDLDNDDINEYIVCYTVDYPQGVIGDGEPQASSGIMLLDSNYKKIADLVNLKNGFWHNIKNDNNKYFLSLKDVEYVDIDKDGIMEVLIGLPTYEGNTVSIIKYSNNQIEGKINFDVELSA